MPIFLTQIAFSHGASTAGRFMGTAAAPGAGWSPKSFTKIAFPSGRSCAISKQINGLNDWHVECFFCGNRGKPNRQFVMPNVRRIASHECGEGSFRKKNRALDGPCNDRHVDV